MSSKNEKLPSKKSPFAFLSSKHIQPKPNISFCLSKTPSTKIGTFNMQLWSINKKLPSTWTPHPLSSRRWLLGPETYWPNHGSSFCSASDSFFSGRWWVSFCSPKKTLAIAFGTFLDVDVFFKFLVLLVFFLLYFFSGTFCASSSSFWMFLLFFSRFRCFFNSEIQILSRSGFWMARVGVDGIRSFGGWSPLKFGVGFNVFPLISWESKGTHPPKATPPGNKALLRDY